MAKSKKEKQQDQSAPASVFASKSNSVDPALASLFASSVGLPARFMTIDADPVW